MYRLFGIKLPTLGLNSENELYYRTSGNVTFDKEKLILCKGASISLDTYFNCFSLGKYQKFTTLKGVTFALDLIGKGEIRIKRVVLKQAEQSQNKNVVLKQAEQSQNKNVVLKQAEQSQNKNVAKKGENSYNYLQSKEETLCVQSYNCQDRQTVTINVAFDQTIEGYLYAEIVAESDTTFFGGEYLTTQEKGHNIKIGIVICTYRREEYVLSNLRRLNKHLQGNQILKNKLEVFLIDNGKTIKSEDVAIGTVYPNQNLGGSGGFTRGIVEVHKRKDEFTHFLLMDDDIVFDSEVFDRLVSILEYAKDIKELSVGGTMLILDKPYIQHENGSNWGGMSIIPNNCGFDMRCKQSLIMSERDLPVAYNAWWFMCMPVSKVDEYGLPLPMFIKGDDIEYSLRCCKQIMVVNGLGVWHEGFDKKYSGELEYYIKRNEMIVNAIYRPDIGALFHIKKLIRAVGKQLVYQRYYAVELLFKAYNDFLKGADYFITLDGEALHSEIRLLMPKQYTYEELIEQGYQIGEDVYHGKKSKGSYLKQVFTLNGYLIPSCMYNKQEKKHGRVVDMFLAKPKDFFKSKTTIQYNVVAGKGFVTKLKRMEVVKAVAKIVAIAVKMFVFYNKKTKEYRFIVK